MHLPRGLGRRLTWLALLGGLAQILAGPPASAYVRARDGRGRPTRWYGSRVELTLFAARTRPDLTQPTLSALRRAAHVWAAASGLEFSVASVDTRAGQVAEDGINAVILSSDFCGEQATLEHACDGQPSHALTTPYMRAQKGNAREAETIEADIEVNTDSFRGGGPDTGRQLQAVLLHELGHVLGLDHVCRASVLGDARDHRGARVPRCDDAAPGVLDGVMYPDPLDRRFGGHSRLGRDELLAVRTLYRHAPSPPPVSQPRSIRIGPALWGSAIGATALLLCSLWWARRARRP